MESNRADIVAQVLEALGKLDQLRDQARDPQRMTPEAQAIMLGVTMACVMPIMQYVADYIPESEKMPAIEGGEWYAEGTLMPDTGIVLAGGLETTTHVTYDGSTYTQDNRSTVIGQDLVLSCTGQLYLRSFGGWWSNDWNDVHESWEWTTLAPAGDTEPVTPAIAVEFCDVAQMLERIISAMQAEVTRLTG